MVTAAQGMDFAAGLRRGQGAMWHKGFNNCRRRWHAACAICTVPSRSMLETPDLCCQCTRHR